MKKALLGFTFFILIGFAQIKWNSLAAQGGDTCVVDSYTEWHPIHGFLNLCPSLDPNGRCQITAQSCPQD